MPRSSPFTVLLTALALVAGSLAAPALQAQGRDRLTVYVYDEFDGAPLPQATIAFVLDDSLQRRFTDEEGRLIVRVPPQGRIEFEVRRIGYAPTTMAVTLPVPRNRLEITLTRAAATLARVEVTAGPSVSGVVASSISQQPIAGAVVTILGSRARARTDSAGRFALPAEAQPTLTVSVSAKGFAPTLLADRLDAGESRELVILLDTISLVGNRLYQNLDDRDERVRWRGTNAGAVGGRELRGTGARSLADAMRSSASVNAKGLIFDDAACLFVDGDPRPGQTLASFPTEDAQLVEFYGAGDDVRGRLSNRWPRNQPCGTAAPRARNINRAVWIVVWTR